MTQARELPPLYMVIDSDDTEYKYATYEDADEALELLIEVYNDEMAQAFAEAAEDGADPDEGIIAPPAPYMQKWNALIGEWEAMDW